MGEELDNIKQGQISPNTQIVFTIKMFFTGLLSIIGGMIGIFYFFYNIAIKSDIDENKTEINNLTTKIETFNNDLNGLNISITNLNNSINGLNQRFNDLNNLHNTSNNSGGFGIN